ncbi:hypothetical protein JW935_23575 [candidate division KSB1 bacterium]|nr:hypothetical protein [candidate division KSB1 bacterium]
MLKKYSFLIILIAIHSVLASSAEQQQNFQHLIKKLNTASPPTKYFVSPSARVLNSLEILFSGGSSYGVEESGALLARFGLGLGGVAEIDFSTTQVVNELTGDRTEFPSRTLKVNVVPESIRDRWWMPNLAAQLRTSSWGTVVRQDHKIAQSIADGFRDVNEDYLLQSLNLMTRFTTLYIITGKDYTFGGFSLGATLIDVRTKEGGQWLYNNKTFQHEFVQLPELQENILKPFGGFYFNVNPNTQIMSEVHAIPVFHYSPEEKEIQVKRAWAGIGGVRFFMLQWLTWDAGVRYISSYKGIADAEITMNLNIILPLK